MPVSKLDTVYRKLILSKFFTKGWGKPENLKKLFEFRKVVSNRQLCLQLVSPNHPVVITKEVVSSDTILLEGHFLSPFDEHLPGLLPPLARKAYFQVLLPTKWRSDHYKPVCLHLAGTGDHFFFRRRNLMAKPLLKDAGIGAILLENPFYGLRKPKDQVWSCLHNVSDIFVMGGCLILESLVLFHWCKRMGLGPLGVTGISMGGHMASLAATNWPEPIVLVPCLSWSTASIVFTRGVMSGAINWDLLEAQYFDNEIYSKEIQRMVKVVDDFIGADNGLDDSYMAGQHFAKNFPDSLDHVDEITSDAKQSNFSTVSAIEDEKNAVTATENGEKIESIEMEERNVLKEVLQESNLQHYARFLNRNPKQDLEAHPINIRDYLAFRSKAEVSKKIFAAESAVRMLFKYWNCWQVPDQSSTKVKKGEEKDIQRQRTSRFMCGIMDECTHLSNFSVPIDPELIISIAAKDDAYVPRDGITDLRDIWKGAEVRYLDAGHVGAYLLHQKVFRTAIVDAFEKLRKKYYNDESSQDFKKHLHR